MTNHDLSNKMVDTINKLGNALTAAGWPEKKTDPILIEDTKEIYKVLMDQQAEVYRMEGEFHDAVNELCYKCGSYRQEHEGACDGCRWRKPRRGW